MGGSGSGRHWHFGAKDTTDDYRTLDVRRWQREGYLEPGRWFGWQWTRDGETVASIQVRAESDRVILSYRHQQRGGGEWKSEEYPVYLDRTPCAHAGLVPLPGQRRRATGGDPVRTAARSSPVGTATGGPIPASGKHPMSEQRDGLTKSERGWAGSRAFSIAPAGVSPRICTNAPTSGLPPKLGNGPRYR